MAPVYNNDELEIEIIARAIARRATSYPIDRRKYIVGPAITSAATRHFGGEGMSSGEQLVDFIDALTVAVFDEIEELERGSG